MYATYIKSPACVIVVVMPATEDSATQRARGIAKKYDPTGERTIGVVTKVDRSDNPEDVVRRLQGEGANGLRFKLGAVALRNPKDDKPSERSRLKADSDEAAFFKSNAAFSKLDQGMWGLSTLEAKLGQVQLDRYTKAIPGLRLQISEKLSRCSTELKELPEAPSNPAEAQRLYARFVYGFSDLVNNVADLRYSSLQAFGLASETPAATSAETKPDEDQETPKPTEKSLHFMPRLMELFDKFSEQVRLSGSLILDKRFHDKIKEKHREVRGKSLDDTHLGLVFDGLVRDEVEKLRAPCLSLLRSTHELMRATVGSLVRLHFTSSERLANAVSNTLEGMLLQSKDECKERIDELLEQEGHPLTLNHYYSETLAKLTASPTYNRAWLRELCRTESDLQPAGENMGLSNEDDANADKVLALASNAANVKPVPLMGSNAEEAIIQLQFKLYAYRKVVQKRFVDQVAALLRLKFPLRLAKEGAKVLENNIRLRSEAPQKPASAGAGSAALVAASSAAVATSSGPRPRFDLEDLMAPSASLAAKKKQLETSVQRLSAALQLLDDSV
jgi:Dynamin central region/Dynamin family